VFGEEKKDKRGRTWAKLVKGVCQLVAERNEKGKRSFGDHKGTQLLAPRLPGRKKCSNKYRTETPLRETPGTLGIRYGGGGGRERSVSKWLAAFLNARREGSRKTKKRQR